MPDFSHTREWWPHFLMDEMMPPGRKTPGSWLEPDGSGVTVVHADDDEEKTVAGRIEPGEIVTFIWHEDRGQVDILLKPDGTWSLTDPRDGGTIDMFTGTASAPPPPAASIETANWFAEESDFETTMDSMDEFARCYVEMCGDIEPEGRRVTVAMGHWSRPVLFYVSADGKSLEQVDG
jgi:hypothetical protein